MKDRRSSPPPGSASGVSVRTRTYTRLAAGPNFSLRYNGVCGRSEGGGGSQIMVNKSSDHVTITRMLFSTDLVG